MPADSFFEEEKDNLTCLYAKRIKPRCSSAKESPLRNIFWRGNNVTVLLQPKVATL